MATTLNWPSVLAEVLVSGAPIRENGLVGWWSMNRTALDGAVLRDDSGNGNDATIVGATPVDGVSGKGLSFDGVNDYATASHAMPSDAISLVFWAKHSALSGVDTVFKVGAGYNNNGFYSQSNSGSAAHSIIFSRAGASEVLAEAFVLSESMSQYAIVVTRSTRQYAVYTNGALTKSGFLANVFDAPSASLFLGGYSATTNLFNGHVDEVRLYRIALTAEEVAARYRRVTSYQAIPEYPLADGFSETVQDGALRSRMDSGLEKIRRRFTATPTLYSTRYQLTAEQKQLLDYFYRTTTRGGTLRFNWPHPHGYSVEARFRAPPAYSALDVETIASVQLEVLA